jgi:hypothetical protein
VFALTNRRGSKVRVAPTGVVVRSGSAPQSHDELVALRDYLLSSARNTSEQGAFEARLAEAGRLNSEAVRSLPPRWMPPEQKEQSR